MLKYNQIGQFSSFAFESKQKGLLTFYEEQWASSIEKNIHKNDRPSDFEKQNHPKPKIKNNDLKETKIINQVTPKTFVRSQKKSKRTVKTEQNETHNSQFINLNKKQRVIHIQNSQDTKGQKQNIIEICQKKMFPKIFTLPKIRKKRVLESIHIHNFTFKQIQDLSVESNDQKCDIFGKKMNKGASFGRLYKQNASVCTIGLDKNVSFQIKKEKDRQFYQWSSSIIQRNRNVSKPIYMFPLASPQRSFFKRKINENNSNSYEDSLNRLCQRLQHKQKGNTEKACKNLLNLD